MKSIIIRRLFDSFRDLEKAIVSAKLTLQEKGNAPAEILERISVYEEMLMKQRTLATALCGYAALGNWEEVSRHIRLISGLSAMIRDDAREVLAASRSKAVIEQREAFMC